MAKGVLAGVGALIVVVLLFGGCGMMAGYNKAVSLEQNVEEKWSQVENVYQRRADLIPNLVNTVQGYATHERETFTAVTEARAKVGQINLNAKDLTPENLQKFQAAQDALSGALSRLMVVVERYPELKSDKLFLGLMSQLEGTENRITVERMRYGQAARDYNTVIKTFPFSLANSMFLHFEPKPYFKADEGASKAPKVDFSKPGTSR